MGIPESPSARGTCPSDEELAAFLDGMLPAAERARITAHLADCESCYEIFAGAVHFQEEEEASDGRDEEPVEGKEGRIVPFPVKQESDTRSRKSPWWAVAAAAVLVLGGGLAGYRLLFPSEPKLELADLKAKVNPAQDFYVPVHYRGGDNHLDSFADDAPKFMIGVLLTDIRLGREQGSIDAARLEEVGRKLLKVNFADPEVQKKIQTSVGKLNSGNPTAKEEVAKSLPAQEAAIEASVDSQAYQLGMWSEAGRLAAVTKTPAFFSRRSNERFFAALKTSFSQEEGIAEPLEAIKTIMDRGVHQADFDPLAKNFKEIIRHYDI